MSLSLRIRIEENVIFLLEVPFFKSEKYIFTTLHVMVECYDFELFFSFNLWSIISSDVNFFAGSSWYIFDQNSKKYLVNRTNLHCKKTGKLTGFFSVNLY